MPVSPWPIRVFNRHLDCIKKQKISYVPVSHAWHENVAAAQDDHVDDVEASRAVYQTPVKTLLALSRRFPGSEIWHDYLSVPQWQADIQGRLLLAIPEIYNSADMTVVHLDDVRAVHVSDNPKDSSYEKFIVDLSAIIRSRYFDRMWVTLEYIQSNKVMILTEDYCLCNMDAQELCHLLDATHSKWVKDRSNSDVTLAIWAQRTTLKRMVSWTDMETWKTRHDMPQTLGAAIAVLGHRQCRHPRDYYLALGKMLGFQPENALVLIKDSFHYYLSLAAHSLREGDYTPLLLIPQDGEKMDHRAPWLHGHSIMTWKLWDMGRCHRHAASRQIIRNGKIQPRLESVGVLEWFEYYDFGGDAALVVDDVASKIVRASGKSADAMVEAADRIFPLDEMKAVNMKWDNAKEEEDEEKKEMQDGKPIAASSQAYNLTRVQTLLNDYSTLVFQQAGHKKTVRKRMDLAKKMATALKLGKKGKYASESRLEAASGEAQWFVREYGRSMEGIGQVFCIACGMRSIFRLTVWEPPPPEAATVYRIPGLVYDDAVPEGVGMVVLGKRVVGKMMYGTPACECKRMEFVELGDVDEFPTV